MAKRIVVVGGGFAGLHLIRRLERILRPGEVELTLLDRNNYHLFTPLLYQVATGELPPHAVAYPLRLPIAHVRQRFVQTEVEDVDVERRAVRTADGDIPYDHLVLVPGSVTNDFGIPGVAEYALATKTLVDGMAVRKRILETVENAAREADPDRRKALLSFVIIGAGPVGVELASSLRDLMDHSLRQMYPELDLVRDAKITLLDGNDRVLTAMDQRLAHIAMTQLAKQRVNVVLKTFVSDVGEGIVRTTDGKQFRGGTVVWAGGVRTNPLVAGLAGVTLAKDKRLVVDRTFRAGGRDDLLSFGDAAFFEHHGKPLPQLAQVAVLEAPAVARNLAHLVRGEPLEPYVYKRKGDLVALGRTSAGAELAKYGHVVLSGLPAWTVWRVNYLTQLLGVRNRASLLLEWILSYFFTRIVADTP
ncbi:MAG TPA: NAD(P)/FAD-dependent oxidoreductase [Candidatus Limnocylindria bacterium]|nr:NAD(P)/FAD-dependent oxidoreductase [Candidatus Limnocylindria bacterium]